MRGINYVPYKNVYTGYYGGKEGHESNTGIKAWEAFRKILYLSKILNMQGNRLRGCYDSLGEVYDQCLEKEAKR